jgi:peptidoglycan/LPS O-acetylase OafA/YrhL
MKPFIKQIGHLNTIDFLRGIAALCVVIHHAGDGASFGSKNTTIQHVNHLFSYGSLGVPLFFVISGFCIHRRKAEQLANKIETPISFKKYWIRRFFRLYPAYITVCILSGLLMLGVILGDIPSLVVDSYPGNHYRYLGLDFITHLLMLHCFFSYFDTGLGNGPLWTIAREEQYYLLYFPLLKLRKYFSIWSCLFIAIIASYIACVISPSVSMTNKELGHVIANSSLTFWPQWVLGMIGIEILLGLSRGSSFLNYRFLPIAGLLVVIWQFESGNSRWFQILMYGIGFFTVVVSLAKIEMVGRWNRNSFVRLGEFIGQYSYSLYLVHAPFAILFGKFGRTWGSQESLPKFLVVTLFTVLFCQIPALLLYRLVERYGQTKVN